MPWPWPFSFPCCTLAMSIKIPWKLYMHQNVLWKLHLPCAPNYIRSEREMESRTKVCSMRQSPSIKCCARESEMNAKLPSNWKIDPQYKRSNSHTTSHRALSSWACIDPVLSMLSGLLVTACGYNVGGPLIGAAFDNERGFYERIDVVLQNDAFMGSQNIGWSTGVRDYDAEQGSGTTENRTR